MIFNQMSIFSNIIFRLANSIIVFHSNRFHYDTKIKSPKIRNEQFCTDTDKINFQNSVTLIKLNYSQYAFLFAYLNGMKTVDCLLKHYVL